MVVIIVANKETLEQLQRRILDLERENARLRELLGLSETENITAP